MSKITKTRDMAWYPPQFPAQGRLPTQAYLVGNNCHQQDSQERGYRQELCVAADRRVEPPCCKTLHISLFFDGTGNNLNNDAYLSDPKHPTNIARLFRATIGNGYAGGTDSEKFDNEESTGGKYFKYYIPGVGTPFPEINDLDYNAPGLVGAARGEDRINWGLLRLIDMLKRVLQKNKLDDAACNTSLKAMETSWKSLGLGGAHNRYEEFQRLFKELAPVLKPALLQPEPGKPKLLGIKLYVYGFSRGAAEARTFVNWLSELLPKPTAEGKRPEQCLAVGDVKLPISVEFLGLLDTVASVGVAHIAPIAEGHMAWADGTQELPDETTYRGLVKRCVHLVASHEQRLCFPLDSIRRADGRYPENSVEVIYPGVHSDLGGGYPPGDQGKAVGKNDRFLLSQIALHDMYASAFCSGAPLKVSPASIPKDMSQQMWRAMPPEIQQEFAIAPDLVNRFNAWREVTLNLPADKQPIPDEKAGEYAPGRASVALESATDRQIAWITAWRIDRYAKGSMLQQPFFKAATDTDALPAAREKSQAIRDLKQGAVEARRRDQLAAQPAGKPLEQPLEPGAKDFDPDIARTQLREAAAEFGADYRGEWRPQNSVLQFVADTIPQNAIFLINSDDERIEVPQIKSDGDALVKQLFPALGEASNQDQPTGLVRALFDEQVHDSRAWFMHAALGSREPWSSYFRYRMIYFGSECSKSMSLLSVAGNVVGAATLVGGVIFSFKQKKLSGKLLGLAGTAGAMQLEAKALDILTGEPIPMLPYADQLTAFTQQVGDVVSQQKQLIGEQQLAMAKTLIDARWANQGLPSAIV